MKLIVSLCFVLGMHTAMSAQTWEQRELSGLKYEFPTPNQKINTAEAFGLSYQGDNIYLTITSIPDTTDFKPETQLARSRYYAATAASTMFRLGGKMVEAKDTMIGETHLYYSVIETLMPDSAVSKYELLQYLQRDTLHGFSCQYIITDKESIATRDHFYNSISFSNKRVFLNPMILLIAGIILSLAIIIFVLRRRA